MSQQSTSESLTPLQLNESIDSFIKEKCPNIDADEMEYTCHSFGDLYKTIKDKVLFNNLYIDSFTKRLILMGEKCLEYEEKVIAAIRKHNPNFMFDFDRYKNVFNISQKLSQEYQDKNHGEIQIDPICFHSSLVKYSGKEKLPEKVQLLSAPCQPISDFYNQKNEKESLELLPELSLVDLSLSFADNKNYTITTDFLCASVIMSIYEKPLNFDEIKSLLNNRVDEATEIVNKLSECNLIKNQSSDNTYSINSDFQSNDEKIIISCNYENKKIESSADFEKEDAIVASIVRILKRKSKIDVDLLRDEVCNSLSPFFELNNSMFSRCLMKVSRFWKDEKVDGKRFIIYVD